MLTTTYCTLVGIVEWPESALTTLLLYKTKLGNRVQEHTRLELFHITPKLFIIQLTGPQGQLFLSTDHFY